MKVRKALENPAAGGIAMVLGFFGLFGAFIACVLGFAEESTLTLVAGSVVGVLSLISMVSGILSRMAQYGPHLLDFNGTALHDLQTGDIYPWDTVQSLRQVLTSGGEALELSLRGNSPKQIPIAGLDVPAETVAKTAFDLHRQVLGKGSLESELHQTGATILCPSCHEESDSLKNYSYITLLFLVVFYGWQTASQIGCPSCTRKMIGKNLLVNILTANITWPFIILPWNLILLVMSFTRGHSKSVLKVLAEGIVASGHESR
jgi:hypothetical protein